MPFCTQSHSKFQHFTFLSKKMDIETVCFENPKLNPKNHYNQRTPDFVTLLTVFVYILR